MEALGKRINALRNTQGWSRAVLARKLGVSRDLLSKWERGEHQPPLRILTALSRLLGLSLDELVTGEPTARRPWDLETRREIARKLAELTELLRSWGALEGGDAQGDES